MAAINPAPPSNPPAGPPAPRNHVVVSQSSTGSDKEMTAREKLDSIRAWMIKENLQGFMIGSGDAHQVKIMPTLHAELPSREIRNRKIDFLEV
jgi:hypothetical protein